MKYGFLNCLKTAAQAAASAPLQASSGERTAVSWPPTLVFSSCHLVSDGQPGSPGRTRLKAGVWARAEAGKIDRQAAVLRRSRRFMELSRAECVARIAIVLAPDCGAFCDDRRGSWDDRHAGWDERDERSAPNRRQSLEALAIAAAEVHLGAILQADAPVAAHPGHDL